MQSYDEVLDTIIASDPRYLRDAYHFVREGLDYTQQTISKQEDGTVRHITGQELLGGMRAIAQMVSYEIPLVLSAVIVVMMVGSRALWRCTTIW